MNDVFETEPYPNQYTLQDLADQLNLEPKSIKVLFKNNTYFILHLQIIGYPMTMREANVFNAIESHFYKTDHITSKHQSNVFST